LSQNGGAGAQVQADIFSGCVLEPTDCPYAPLKRILDIIGASLGILVLSPVFLILAILVKVSSKGPILYRSERIGYLGKPFTFLKFRSMYADADKRLHELMAQNEKDGPIFKIKNDPRITPIGRTLRRYSLDELPQLFNVLRGEMSLVGPRPPLRREVEQYTEEQLKRLTVLPGCTCYWQIMGRSDLSFEEWMELDLKYIREMSLWTDIKILIRTPLAILPGKGAY
jgi:exopolysaccharide biosynthesis polyprenyl glycosylphosphotransferase